MRFQKNLAWRVYKQNSQSATGLAVLFIECKASRLMSRKGLETSANYLHYKYLKSYPMKQNLERRP